jgi:transcriptional regulator
MRKGADLLQGTLDLLILQTLEAQTLHGWAIAQRIRDRSLEVLKVNQGSLYPALYRLEDKGYLASDWSISPEGRRAKFYRLTAAGRRQLNAERDQWQLFSAAVNHVIAPV